MTGWFTLAERTIEKAPTVNIWSLQKSTQIKCLLLILVERIGQGGWYIDQETRVSEEAVYLVHAEDVQLRAYLHVHGQQPEHAGLHLEYPRIDGAPPTFDAFDNLNVSRLVDMLAAHFGISQVDPQPDRMHR